MAKIESSARAETGGRWPTHFGRDTALLARAPWLEWSIEPTKLQY